jgi:hypothetical protein
VEWNTLDRAGGSRASGSFLITGGRLSGFHDCMPCIKKHHHVLLHSGCRCLAVRRLSSQAGPWRPPTAHGPPWNHNSSPVHLVHLVLDTASSITHWIRKKRVIWSVRCNCAQDLGANKATSGGWQVCHIKASTTA